MIIIVTLVSFTMTGCTQDDMPDDNYRNYYEVFVGAFCDSNGDGCGDINGVTDKLEYISELGCNGIWLTPIMPSPTYHKYDVTDYCAVDSSLGTIEDFDKLVNRCHKKNIRLIIDMVVNHTSSEHPWFVQATEYLRALPSGADYYSNDCPYVEYYHFTKEDKGAGWCKLDGTEYYYECNFWEKMPDLNLSNAQLTEELHRIFDFWLEHGVDGFRMDAPLHYEENDDEFNCRVLSDIYEYCKGINPNFYMVSEVWAGEDTIASYYSSDTPSMFNFTAADAEGRLIKTARGTAKASRFVEAMVEWQDDFGAYNPDYIDAVFITNHDMSRCANALTSDEDSIKFAGGLLSTLSGNTFIYYGEEVGMKSGGKKDENKRLPMHWSDNDLKDTPDRFEGADDGIEQTFAGVDEQSKDDSSILSYYRHAYNLRLEKPQIARGDVEIMDEYTDGDTAVICKTYGDSYVYVAYNTADEVVTIDLSNLHIQGTVCGNLNVGAEVNSLSDGLLTMQPKSITYFE